MFEAMIKQTEPTTVAYIAMRGAYSQTPEGFGRLYGWVAEHGMQPTGMPYAVYYTSPADTPESEALWELRAPVAGPSEMEPDSEGRGVQLVPAMTVASTTHIGPYDTIAPTYAALADWVSHQGYRMAGPPAEFYFSDPKEVPPEEYVTEVQFPVEKI